MPAESSDTLNKPSYFLIAVSTRENLELCIRYGLAGFPSGESGAWTFCEIQNGDFASFLYGARAYNLYKVTKRESIADAEHLPPWRPLVFKDSGKSHSFPFRLRLQPIRTFVEPIVRTEFFYVAENLLLRGGYRKTHFQADQTTLQSVSEMGTLAGSSIDPLFLPEYTTFALRFTRNRELLKTPETLRFRETILQSAIRRHLMTDENLERLFSQSSLGPSTVGALEILGEKAITQGHIDLLLKQRVPLGSSPKIPIEVKTPKAQPKDLAQLRGYMDELLDECPLGILIASDFTKDVVRGAPEKRIHLVRFALNFDLKKEAATFEEICAGICLEPFEK
jgi:hypothetical protein